MIAEIGLFCLAIAWMFSALLFSIPLFGIWRSHLDFQRASTPYTYGLFLFMGLAYLCLTLCFLNNDFSVIYVLQNSSIKLPWFYKLCAVWGGHEGSMLLWVTILSLWMVGVARYSHGLSLEMKACVLSILGFVSFGFILFLLMTSNPFTRQFVELAGEGKDLNPLLQDPGFLFHPPMLYMGYVGFSVAFAFAVSALLLGKIEKQWSRWARPWTLAAWSFLTCGITLGSWWAYRELGWGGWWFWDPVESASFMPWLVGTALIHALAVCEKRSQFAAWTLFLAICAFSLSLIGTFLVRSGVLTSVHAFAVDPQRGLYILCFLMVVIGGSLLLFAFRGRSISQKQLPTLLSRESGLLFGNVLFAVMMFTVLMGTVYPLIIDGLGLGKLSVGAPYFNAVFIPLFLPVLLLMGLGIHLKWNQDSLKRVAISIRKPLFLSLGLTVLFLMLDKKLLYPSTALGFALALWVILSTIQSIYQKYQHKQKRSRAYWGMVFAHLGVAVTVLGIVLSSGLGMQKDVRLSPGESTQLLDMKVKFISESELEGPNYHGVKVEFDLISGNKIKKIFPEKRIYDLSNMPMTDSAIDVNPIRDVYIALGEPIGDSAWSVRIYYKPFIRWIWGGGFMILMGALLAMCDRRYYRSTSNANQANTAEAIG